MSQPNGAFDPADLEENLPGAVVPHERTLAGVLGIKVTEASKEQLVAVTPIDDRHRQPYGLVHGGFYAVVGETLASIGAAIWAAEDGKIAVGSSNNTAFMRPFVGDGDLTSTATRLHGGRTTHIWDVEHRDQNGKLCATSRVTVAIREAPKG